MVKKILFAVAGGIVALLVLVFALTMLLSYREFFGTAITWVLCACVAALAVFVVYLVVRYVLETVRKRGHDEEELSEHHIKEMLLSGEPRDKGVIRDGATEENIPVAATLESLFAADATADDRPTGSASPETPPGVRKAVSQRTGDLRRQEEEHRRRMAEAETRARQAAETQQAARVRPGAEPKRPAATAEGSARTGIDDLAKSQEVQSARRQAEAAAAARRRAAEMAARSQSFPAIRPDTLSAIGQEGSSLYADAANSKIRYANEPVPYEASGEDSIWDRMQVRRSAAPTLTQSELQRGKRPDDTALEDVTGDFAPVGYTDEIRARMEAAQASQRAHTGSIRLESAPGTPEEQAAQGWAYAPAKPPRAWNADSRKIPGDMSFTPVPESPDARAEAAAERKAAAQRTRPEADPRRTAAAPKPAASRTTTTEVAKPADAAKRPPATGAAAAPATGGEEVKRPRGRPPKPKTEEELNAPKRPRGRPPKPKTEEELNAPKHPRGRPPKPKTEEELNAPKRPRGRPRKNPLPEDGAAAQTDTDANA